MNRRILWPLILALAFVAPGFSQADTPRFRSWKQQRSKQATEECTRKTLKENFPWLACAQSRTKISPYKSTPSNRFSRMNQSNFGIQD
ncbi:MAG: hypothetical protein H6Q07_917 [Acidobacteria bacterium]|nr:hypothetical protein [Acidobacteriota bacterium]